MLTTVAPECCPGPTQRPKTVKGQLGSPHCHVAQASPGWFSPKDVTYFHSSGRTVSWSLPDRPPSGRPAWPPSPPSHRRPRGGPRWHGLPAPECSGRSQCCSQDLLARLHPGTCKGRRILSAQRHPQAGEGERRHNSMSTPLTLTCPDPCPCPSTVPSVQ